MERNISRNPCNAEIRLHCLDMAVRSAAVMGRADNLFVLAEQNFAWVTTGTKPGEPRTTAPGGRQDDDGEGLGGEGGSGEGEGSGDGKPASLRQARGGPKE
jgi:hypothetical protein